ncbi:MAG: hypothetical protein IKH71_04975 [Oscillospiraceae bacterium]|nr:hypothetical protein [Oscillospiraceae bacterium]
MEDNIGLKKTFKECILENLWFKILSFSSIALIFTSLLLPPLGVIDPSVVSSTGELLGWGALFTVIKAIDKGKGISVKHGNTEVEVRKQQEEQEESSEEE